MYEVVTRGYVELRIIRRLHALILHYILIINIHGATVRSGVQDDVTFDQAVPSGLHSLIIDDCVLLRAHIDRQGWLIRGLLVHHHLLRLVLRFLAFDVR